MKAFLKKREVQNGNKLFWLILFSGIFISAKSPSPQTLDKASSLSAERFFDEKFIWEEIRQSSSLKTLKSWGEIVAMNNHLIAIQKDMTQGLILFQDHFYNKFQGFNIEASDFISSLPEDSLFEKENQSDDKAPIRPEAKEQILLNRFYAQFIGLLKQQPFEDIKEFMDKYEFTEADKLMSLIYILSNRIVGSEVIDFINSINLSVNAQLKLKDINSPISLETAQYVNFKNSNQVIGVLSHYLAGTSHPEIIKSLFEQKDYQKDTTNTQGENILHYFHYTTQQLSNLEKVDMSTQTPEVRNYFEMYRKAVKLMIKHSTNKQILQEDSLGISPLDLAIKNSKINGSTLISVEMMKKLQINTFRFKSSYEVFVNYTKSQKEPNSLILDPLDNNFIHLDFQSIVRSIIESIIKSEASPYKQNLNFIHERTHTYFQFMESNRMNTLFQLNPEKENEQLLMLNDSKNREAFRRLSKDKQKELIFESLSVNSKNGQPKIFITNFLLEAIRYSWLEGVQRALKAYETEGKEVFPYPKNQQNFISLDPLSLALITYASLPTDHPSKKEAQNIVQEVAQQIGKKINSQENSSFALEIKPMNWALFLGLREEVEFLHTKTGIPVPEYLFLPTGDPSWPEKRIHSISYTESMDFVSLSNYIKELGLENRGDSWACQSLFNKTTSLH